MKKIIAIFLVCACVSATSWAQKRNSILLEAGFGSRANATNLSNLDKSDNQNWNMAILWEHRLGRKWNFSTGGRWAQRNITNYTDYALPKQQYLQIPFYISYQLLPKIRIGAGGYTGLAYSFHTANDWGIRFSDRESLLDRGLMFQIETAIAPRWTARLQSQIGLRKQRMTYIGCGNMTPEEDAEMARTAFNSPNSYLGVHFGYRLF